MNIARVQGVEEVAFSIATTWGTSRGRISRILTAGGAAARLPRAILTWARPRPRPRLRAG